MSELPGRDRALAILHEYTTGESLRHHAYSVEASMRMLAREHGEDEERWGLTGLLHDMDYERWPDPADHPRRGCEILAEQGWPDDVIQAILGHASYTGVPRESLMARGLYAVDELSGFVVACAKVQPGKDVNLLKLKSVKKKLKNKKFAAAVDREQIRAGAEELGVELGALIELCIGAQRAIAGQLGLDGSAG